MSSIKRTNKSSLFLMELIICLLLFCFLCGFGLILFSKSNTTINDATTLQQAVSLTSSVAEICKNDVSQLSNIYPDSEFVENTTYIFYDEEFRECNKSNFTYILKVSSDDEYEFLIEFTDNNKNLIYTLTVYNHLIPSIVSTKEVAYH